MLEKTKRALKSVGSRLSGFFGRFGDRPSGRNKALGEEADLLDAFGAHGDGDTASYKKTQADETDEAGFSSTRAFVPVSAWSGKEPKAHAGGEEGEPLFVYPGRRKRPFVLGILFTSLKLGAFAIFLLGCLGLGIGLGFARAYVETTPTLDTAQLTNSNLTSYIYDMNGNLITTFAGMEYRDWANIEEIPDMLKNAVIAVEDVRFYKHQGLDYKRLFSAVINTLRNSDTHGGSTITQQLIKNKILSTEQTYKRKIQEAYLAVELEGVLNKDDILEAYLNDVFLGESNYGMKTAAKDYFGKDLSELTIRECAMLAGMIQKPYYTNPRANLYKRTLDESYRTAMETSYQQGLITKEQYARALNENNRMYVTDQRTNTVLYAMYTGGFITREQYDSAMGEQITVLEVSEQKQLYEMPYFVEYAVRDVITHLLAKRNLLDTLANRSAIENELRTGGYHIYTTVDPSIQNTVQETLSTWTGYPELADPTQDKKVTTSSDGSPIEVVEPQAAAVVFDYRTGELRAVVGGRDTPTRKKEWNRTYQSATPVGSSIKPLAVYGPALDMGVSPATIINNFPGKIDGYGGSGYPALGNRDYLGPITVREGVIQSLNIVAARTLFEYVTPQVSQQYLVNLGVDPSRINVDGPGLALGTSGITPIEMAAAFGAIAAGGEYKEPLAFTKVTDKGGNVILSADEVRKTQQVFQKSTCYLLVDMLMDAVQKGTGTRAKISGMTVAGKTGTNSDYSSVYFAGMTPYYSASVWIGHDDYEQKLKDGASGGRYAAPLWQAFMAKIHQGLSDSKIIDATPESLGLVKARICSVSGLLATEACEHDSAGHTPVTDWFVEGSAPTKKCDMHVMVNVCTQSHMQATANCPSVAAGSIVLIRSDSPLRRFSVEDLREALPNYVFSDIPASDYSSMNYEPGALCPLHGGAVIATPLEAARAQAELLMGRINAFIFATPQLEDAHVQTLNASVSRLSMIGLMTDVNSIFTLTEQERQTFEAIAALYQNTGTEGQGQFFGNGILP
ncbi:MAG: transglycosylase domain-containing protein [Bacillota bacterium]